MLCSKSFNNFTSISSREAKKEEDVNIMVSVVIVIVVTVGVVAEIVVDQTSTHPINTHLRDVCVIPYQPPP